MKILLELDLNNISHKVLAEIDGIEMTDEEVELNAKAQPSPYRMKVEEKMQRLKKVMIGEIT